MLPPVGAAMRRALTVCLVFSAAACCTGCGKPPAPYAGYNLVLVTIETTRSDFLGCYGSDADCTPFLDSLAARGTLVRTCYTVAPWTRPSMASIWTGLAPSRHGVVTNGLESRLPESARTLAEVLAASGYKTFGCITNINLAPELGFSQGFDTYSHHSSARGEQLTDLALEWAASARRGNDSIPVFMALHYDEPHGAYFQAHFGRKAKGTGRAAIVRMCEGLDHVERLWGVELYRAQLRRVDAAIGRLVEGATKVLGDRCVFVVTADHGEEWFDHGGLFHGFTLHDELLSVPLIIYVPGQEPCSVSGPVRTIDLFPTMCEWLGVRAPEDVDGTSLVRALRNGRGFPSEIVVETSFREPMQAVRWKNFKLIANLRSERVTLFDTRVDPREHSDCAPRHPEVRRSLENRLLSYRSTMAGRTLATIEDPASAGAPLDTARLVEELRGIGYLASGAEALGPVGEGVRVSWQEVRSKFRFVAPDDPGLHMESTTMRRASVAPRIILGDRSGDRCWGSFSFRKAHVIFDKHDWSGITEIQVDGGRWALVDLFAPVDRREFHIVPIEFPECGEHRIDVIVTGEKNPASSSSEVLLDGIALEREPVGSLAAARAGRRSP